MNKIATFFRESNTARALIPIGLILTIFGIVMFFINTKNSNYIKTEATVIKSELREEAHEDSDGNRVEATYEVYFKYTVDGKDYENSLDGLSERKEGDKLTIYYNPDDPEKITQTKSLILPIVLIAAGIAAFIGGIISGINAIKKVKKMKAQEKEWEEKNA